MLARLCDELNRWCQCQWFGRVMPREPISPRCPGSHLWCPPSRTCLKHPTWKCSGTTSAGSLRRGGVEELVRERSFPLWSSSSQSGRNVAQPVTQQLPFHAQLSLHHSKWWRRSARVVQLVLLCSEWKHNIRRITPVFVIKHYFSFVNFGQQLRWICALADVILL